jgi:hypothetical protein
VGASGPRRAVSPVLLRYLAVAPGPIPNFPVDRHASTEDYARIAPDVPVPRITTADTPTTTS